ncbi:MAG TPA: dTDP-4-dehydrorhamnose 3,5-epimerase family protein [Egicoccus sp.]|nr:dTDP-4-dehydrorhamnose 3,5-epimerase family protein [Egicoccus sp.]HSK22110.1 dTDP-4-dehydrorhamnose 3,5-epimerase family protein [Egicoccus sp.]
MPIEPTDIEGLFVVSWDTHADDRGFFRQTYQVSELERLLGRSVVFRQGNHARSRPGVLRGFHAEPWDKLVYVARGTVEAAVADVRPDSPTFGEVRTFRLGDDAPDRRRLYLTRGLANSYCVLGGSDADYLYDATAEWSPTSPRVTVAWDDPDLAVDWPVTDPVLSPADRANPTLRRQFPDHPRWRR